MARCYRSGLFVLGMVATISGRGALAQSEAPIAPVAPEPAPPVRQEALLRPGQTVTLRIRQVIPRDGLSPGDRVLNGLPPLVPGDRLLAEVIAPGPHVPALLGGTVARIDPPGKFGKPGRVALELGQLVTFNDGRSAMVPWVFDLEDRRFNVRMRRRILLALFALEGVGVGASVGAQLAGGNNPFFVGGGAGVGLLSGIGYASLMPGRQATLEPGETFQVKVGTLSYRPVAPAAPLELYPARSRSGVVGAHGP